jgi:hypothetical protein
MAFEKTIAQVRQALVDSFTTLDAYFTLPTDLRAYKADKDSWSIDEILEHVSLTSHFC